MNFHVYGYGALALICAGLYAWATIEAKTVNTRDAQIERYKADLVTAQSAVDQAKTVNGEQAETIKALQADLTRQAEVSLRYEDLARSRATKLHDVLKGISNAPLSDDGSIAPVLRRELDRLRLEFASANGAGKNPDRAPDSPSQ